MRLLIAAIVGPLVLIGALPQAAGQSSPSGTQVQAAAGSNAPADRDTYTQKARAICGIGSKSCTTSVRTRKPMDNRQRMRPRMT